MRGDLDWIVLKALEKDRTRRYASASELAADIERHLRDEPVLAGSPSRVYKVKKFACRSLKGKGSQSGMRLIYSYLSESDTVVLIELYYKGDKSNEDRSRIKRLL